MWVRKREQLIMWQIQEENRKDADNNDEGDSSMDQNDDNRFSFVRLITVNDIILESRILEAELRIKDTAIARK